MRINDQRVFAIAFGRSARGARGERRRSAGGFTMVEIALCIAIVGVALVAIIGVLPTGVNVQKENRDETVILQDAQYWMEVLRNGSASASELTNYVDLVRLVATNRQTAFVNYFTGHHLGRSLPEYRPETSGRTVVYSGNQGLVSATNIVGLLSSPKTRFYSANERLTNTVSAVVRAMTGPASEKPRRDVAEGDRNKMDIAFKYLLTAEVVPYEAYPTGQGYLQNGWVGTWQHYRTNLYQVTLTFEWPVFVVNNQIRTGNNRKVFRTEVAGRLLERRDLRPVDWMVAPHFFQPERHVFANY